MAQNLPIGKWIYDSKLYPQNAPRIVIEDKTYVPVEFFDTLCEMYEEAQGMVHEALDKVRMSTADMRAIRLGNYGKRRQ